MAGPPHILAMPSTTEPSEWLRRHDRAIAELERRFHRFGSLSPAEVARTALRFAPKPMRHRCFRVLARAGWLSGTARIRFDALDNPASGGRPGFGRGLALVRLTVFGLPGQGVPYREKHRQDVFQQLCAEIMRTAVDTDSLRMVAARVLNHPDVTGDSVLAGMLRGFIAQREASLKTGATPADRQRELEAESKLRRAFGEPLRTAYPTREQSLATFARLQREFEGLVAQFEESRAQIVLDRMRDLRRRVPAHIPAEDLQRCEELYDKLLRRAGTYRRQIEDLANQAARAAQDGDDATAAWLRRRLHAIHALLPNLLPADRLAALEAAIAQSSTVHEAREATRELLQVERDVAAKIRNLAGIIQRFHEIAARLPPEDNAYRRAALNYRHAVEEIRGMDTEWLTGLVLRLETLLGDLDDPSGKIQTQLDHFVENVRTALNRLCLEIRARHPRRPDRPAPPPSSV